MWAWDTWAGEMNQEQLVEYFRKFMPIPHDWLDWVAGRLGFPEVARAVFAGEGSIEGVRWLEKHGLADYSKFKTWLESRPSK